MAELVQLVVQMSVDTFLGDENAVVGYQVVHIVFAGIHRDAELWIHALQLLTEVGHREHAAANG